MSLRPKESIMKNIFLTTIIGQSKAHTIKSIAETTRAAGGEWLKSKVVKLDNRFAAIMKVSIDPANEDDLKSRLESEYPDLEFSYAPAQKDEAEGLEPVNIVVDCEDRPGLTHDITRVLSDLNLEPENLEINRFPVTPVGGTVYSAQISLVIPPEVSREQLVEELESVSSCSRVNFE